MSFKRLGNDNYIKKEKGKQDKINENSDEIIKSLKDYINVPKHLCEYLILGAKIKYISNQGYFRYGGILINNKFPEYIVLLNPFKKKTWSVDLNKNNIFMEDVKKSKEEKEIKEKLYELYKDDKLSIKK